MNQRAGRPGRKVWYEVSPYHSFYQEEKVKYINENSQTRLWRLYEYFKKSEVKIYPILQSLRLQYGCERI